MAHYTQDNIAVGVIAAGRRNNLDDLAIVCALSCALVESGLQMYANEGDPETLNFPYDALSRDYDSSGIYQQRPPWWGSAHCRMDVACSSKLFYDSLIKQHHPNYHEDAGTAIANVQHPAPQYRNRYAERMDDAWAIFNRLKDAAMPPGPLDQTPRPPMEPTAPQKPLYTEIEMFGWGCNSRTRPPINFFIHTEEGDSSARGLAEFCQGQNNVSYHYTVRDGIVFDVVDTDRYSWSVLDANVFSINLCFAGSRAGWSRDEWLWRERDIEIAAYIAVQDCRKYPTMSTLVIPPPYNFAGPGISDHKYVTQKLGIGTHHDVGDNFPWDVFARNVNRYNGFEGDPDMTGEEHDKLFELWGALCTPVNSESPYAPPGTQLPLKDLMRYTDGSVHGLATDHSAIILGAPDDVRAVKEAADRGVQRAILAWDHISDDFKEAAGYPQTQQEGSTSWARSSS